MLELEPEAAMAAVEATPENVADNESKLKNASPLYVFLKEWI